MKMEKLQTKRRRVYSLEPSRRTQVQVQPFFAKEYVNYLVPALMQNSKLKHSSESNNHGELKKMVKCQTDMALALSARGLTWSNALRNKLHRDINGGKCVRSPSSTQLHPHSSSKHRFTEPSESNSNSNNVEKQPAGSAIRSSDQSGQLIPTEFKPNPSIVPFRKENRKDSEEEDMSVRLKSLRLIMPGGDQMEDDEEMLAELVSYISCLRMQVEVLQSLVQIIGK